MSKPALYLDTASGDYVQFATGREDTAQIQHLEALAAVGAVNLFVTATGPISLGGTTTALALLGDDVNLEAAVGHDLTFQARGTSITLNQVGQESLIGFPGGVTSLIAALNDVKATIVHTDLQDAYGVGNTIALTANRDLKFITHDWADHANFVVQNLSDEVFFQTDTAASSVQLGDDHLNDIVFTARAGSLTFNQVGNVSLVGFDPAVTSIVAALNELRSTPSGGVTATYTTAEAVVVGDAVYMTAAGTIGVADYTVASGKYNALGFAAESKAPGLPCDVILAGEIFVKTVLVAGDLGKQALLGATGNVTTTPPGAGKALTSVGVVVRVGATSKIVVQVAPPIII